MPMEEMPRMRAQEGAPEYQGYTAQHVTRTADYRGFSQHGEVRKVATNLSAIICIQFITFQSFDSSLPFKQGIQIRFFNRARLSPFYIVKLASYLSTQRLKFYQFRQFS